MSINEKLSTLENLQRFFQIKYAGTKMMVDCANNQTTIPADIICNRNYQSGNQTAPYNTNGRIGDLQARWKTFLDFYKELTTAHISTYGYEVNLLGRFQPYQYKGYNCSWFPSFMCRGTVHFQWFMPFPVIEPQRQYIRMCPDELRWIVGDTSSGSTCSRSGVDTCMPVCLASDFINNCIEALETMVCGWGFVDCYTEIVTETRKAYVSETKTAYGTATKYESSTYRIPDPMTGGSPHYDSYPSYSIEYYASSIQHTYSSEDVETYSSVRSSSFSGVDFTRDHYPIYATGRFLLETSRPAQQTSFNIDNYYDLPQEGYVNFPTSYVTQYWNGLNPDFVDVDARCRALSNNVMSVSSYLNNGEVKEDYQKTDTGTRQGLRFYNPYPFDIEVRLTVQTLPAEITVNENPSYHSQYDSDTGQYVNTNFRWGNIIWHRSVDKCWLERPNTGNDRIDIELSARNRSLLGNNISLDCGYQPQIVHKKYGHKAETETTYEEYEYYDVNTGTTRTATDTVVRKFHHIDSPDYDEHGTDYHAAVTNEYFELSNPTTTISNVSSHTVTLTIHPGERVTWFPTEHIPYDGTYDYFQIRKESIYSYVWADCRIKRPQNM